MKRMDNIRAQWKENGETYVVADLQVSTIDELPAIGDRVDSFLIAPGTIAQIIQSDDVLFLTLDDNGTWYPEQSDSASTLSAPLTLGKSPTLAKAVADSDGEFIDLTEPEVEAIRDKLKTAEPEGGEEDAELL